MVQVASPGHTERDPFPVGAVKLVGFFMRVQIGCDAQLLCIFPLILETDI